MVLITLPLIVLTRRCQQPREEPGCRDGVNGGPHFSFFLKKQIVICSLFKKKVSILTPFGGPRNHLPYTKTPRLNRFLSTPLNLALGGPWEGAPPMQVSYLAD